MDKVQFWKDGVLIGVLEKEEAEKLAESFENLGFEVIRNPNHISVYSPRRVGRR